MKPKDIEAGNGTVSLGVMNRDRKRILRYFNASAAINDPRTEADLGDGFSCATVSSFHVSRGSSMCPGGRA
ncbi:MAG: hypothetical protein OXH09_03385 [Gammaproteobacteria bacterium]|nr:hypothetical protein [Gammaproteobacteria bacterium]